MSHTLLTFSAILCLGAARGTLFSQKGMGGPYTIGTFGGDAPQAVKVIRVTNTVAVPVPVPFPYPKHIPYPVSVPKPIPYAVPQPIPVEVSKPVVIRQHVPLEIPKPYPVPQPYSLKSFPVHNFAVPSEHLVAPTFHANQENDYQAYLSYGQEQSYSANQGQTHSSYDYSSSDQGGAGISQHQQYHDQGGVGTSQQQQYHDQGTVGTSEQQQYQNPYNAPPPGLYMVYDGSAYNNNAGLSLGHSFESTNSLDDQTPAH